MTLLPFGPPVNDVLAYELRGNIVTLTTVQLFVAFVAVVATIGSRSKRHI